MNIDLKNICLQACDIIKEVGHFIHAESKKINPAIIESKGQNNFVTYVDKTAEEKLVKQLAKLIPDAGFLTEEDTENTKGYYQWIIDPLDGTTNFIHQIPFYSISVGLTRQDKLVMGIIYDMNRKECFYSWEGGKAYLNKDIINVSVCPTLFDGLIATGFPYEHFDKLDAYIKTLNQVIENSRGVRRLGSAALDLAYVACGRFDGFFEFNLHPWDVAAGAFLVQQAGGQITDFSGKDDFLFGKEIIAGNDKVNTGLVSMLKSNFKS